MKVLFHTYDLAFVRMGGGERVILSLQAALGRAGVTVELWDPWRHSPEQFEIVHTFACRQTEYWAYHRRHFPRVPLCVTPTLPLHSPPGWRAWVKAKVGVRKLPFHLPQLFYPATSAEAKLLARKMGVPEKKILLLPNGIEEGILGAGPELAQTKLGSTEPFVLCAGRFEPTKNQLLLVKALGSIGSGRVVFVGADDPADPGYRQLCENEAKKYPGVKFYFLPALAHEDPLLASLFAAAHVYVQPSLYETFGLAALEADAAGCNLALTREVAAPEIFSSADYFSPVDVGECARAIVAALGKARGGVREQVLSRFSWDAIALELKKSYSEQLRNERTEFSK